MPYTPINDGDTGLSIREKLNTGLALADIAAPFIPILQAENDFGVNSTGASAFNGATVTLDTANSRVSVSHATNITDKGVNLAAPAWEASAQYLLAIHITIGAAPINMRSKWGGTGIIFANVKRSGWYFFEYVSDATPGNIVVSGTGGAADTFYINYFGIYKLGGAKYTTSRSGTQTLFQDERINIGFGAFADLPNTVSGEARGAIAIGKLASAGSGVAIGCQATTAKTGVNAQAHVVIGDKASAPFANGGAVVIGTAAVSEQSETVIGSGATGGGSLSVVIGRDSSCAAATTYSGSATGGTKLAIGAGAKAMSWRAMAIGEAAIAGATSSTSIGVGAFTDKSHQFALGRGTHFFNPLGFNSSDLMHNIGSDAPDNADFFWSNSWYHYADTPPGGITNSNFATPSTREIIFHGQDAYDARATPSSFNIDAGHFTIASGRGTGTGAGGEVRFKTAPSASVEQNTKNALVTAGSFDSATGLTGNKTRFLLLDTTTGTLRRVEFGDADSGGTGYRMMRVAN